MMTRGQIIDLQGKSAHALKRVLSDAIGDDMTVIVIVAHNEDGGEVHIASSDEDLTASLIAHIAKKLRQD